MPGKPPRTAEDFRPVVEHLADELVEWHAWVEMEATLRICSVCGYCLRGLVNQPCPECGAHYSSSRTAQRGEDG